MAKSFKNKSKKMEEIKFDAIQGKIGSTPCSLEYNKVSKRYTLRSDGFLYSNISLTACKNKAADKEVVWS